MNELNDEKVNITTIEDPIEYDLEGISQTQVKEDIGLSFSHILRSILRQDPDIILVGEMRDKETAEIAIRASMTGHLVFSTLHTNDAISSITRLIDMGIQPFLIASSLRMIVAQRLIRKLCNNCQEEYYPENYVLEEYDLDDSKMYFKAVGCKECNHIGYSGRTSIVEILEVDRDVANKINHDFSEKELHEFLQRKNFNPIMNNMKNKIYEGITSIEECFNV